MQMATLSSIKGPLDSESLAQLSESMAHLTGGPFGANLTASVGSHRPKLLVRQLTWRVGPLRNARHEFRSIEVETHGKCFLSGASMELAKYADLAPTLN